MKSYKIIFVNNQGSQAIDAIAAEVDGDWRDTVSNFDGQGHDIGFIDIPDSYAGYLESILDKDYNVITYSRAY